MALDSAARTSDWLSDVKMNPFLPARSECPQYGHVVTESSVSTILGRRQRPHWVSPYMSPVDGAL